MFNFRRKRSGQALVVIVAFSLTLFIFVGLGIDAGILYLERRHLQNVADAACLAASTELTLNTGSSATTAARDKAVAYITSNMNENAKAAFDLSNLNSTYLIGPIGAGQSLTRGIEVSDTGVRVAVNFPAHTYFLNLLNIGTYNVMARANCGPSQGGGVWPIAVVRYPAYDQRNKRIGGVDTMKTLPQPYSGGKNPKYLAIRDALQQRGRVDGMINDGLQVNNGSNIATGLVPEYAYYDCTDNTKSKRRNWYDWGSDPLSPASGYGEPPKSFTPEKRFGPYFSWLNPLKTSCAAQPGLYTTNPASSTLPGYRYELAGQGAKPNEGATSFTGPVMLDIRNISTSPVAYNGQSLQQSTNAWKKSIIKYILEQYPGPEVIPGDELATYSGVNTGNILDALNERYDGNGKDIVTAIVYDGTVQRKDNFELTVTCIFSIENASNKPDCDPTGKTKNNKYVERYAAPSPHLTSQCVLSRPSAYIYSSSHSPNYDDIIKSTATIDERLHPARYVVTLTPQQLSSARTIRLTARLSGLNGSENTAGTPSGFGDIKIRWLNGIWSRSTAATPPTPLTGWIDPNTPFDLTGLSSTVVNLTLEVIQTSPTTVTESCGNPTAITYDMPPHQSGANILQVTGEMINYAPVHSDFAWLGMADSGTTTFITGDYFLSFAEEPVALVQSGDVVATELRPAIQLIRANSGEPYCRGTVSTGPAQCVGLSTNPNTLAPVDLPVVWYKDGTLLGGTGAAPSGASVQLEVACASDPECAQSPSLKIIIPNTLGEGLYYIDFQTPGSTLTTNFEDHSNRYIVRVANATANPSIDSWIEVLCLADFRITTDLTGVTPNSIEGEAVSGCLDEKDRKRGRTGRLLPW